MRSILMTWRVLIEAGSRINAGSRYKPGVKVSCTDRSRGLLSEVLRYNAEWQSVEYRCRMHKIQQHKIITYTLGLTLTLTAVFNFNVILIPHLHNAEWIKLREIAQYYCKIKP